MTDHGQSFTTRLTSQPLGVFKENTTVDLTTAVDPVVLRASDFESATQELCEKVCCPSSFITKDRII